VGLRAHTALLLTGLFCEDCEEAESSLDLSAGAKGAKPEGWLCPEGSFIEGIKDVVDVFCEENPDGAERSLCEVCEEVK
jgi:hypothetical protein